MIRTVRIMLNSYFAAAEPTKHIVNKAETPVD
jgi:hypothetical protein